jgi:hypothetical protein
MFCAKCGAENDGASRYCLKCGAFLDNPGTDNVNGGAAGPAENASGKKFIPFLKKRWMILTPVAVLIIVLLFSFNSILAMVSPAYAVKRASEHTLSLVGRRMENSSLGFLQILSECLRAGSVKTDFSYDDGYTETVGSVTLLSQSAGKNYGIEADMSIDGEDFGLTALFNPERLAFRASVIDDNFYGITYATFKQDIELFADETGLDGNTVEALQELYDYLSSARKNEFKDIAEKYERFIGDFIKGLTPRKTSEQITSNGKTYNCKAVVYEITEDDLVAFLTELKDIVSGDEQLRDYLFSYFDMQNLGYSNIYDDWGYDTPDPDEIYDDLMDQFDELIDLIEDDYSGTVRATFYLSGNELIRAAVSGDPKISGSKIEFEVYIDYGKNPARDDIEIVFSGEGADGSEMELNLTYRSEHKGNTVTDIVRLETDQGDYDSEVTFTSEWDKKTGSLNITAETDYDDFKISGNLTMDNKGFTLELEDLLDGSYSDESLDLTIAASKGVTIPNPDYVNLDKWGEDLLADLQEGLDGDLDDFFDSTYYW